MITTEIKFEEIKRWMTKYGIRKFTFEKPFKVLIAILANGFRDEIEISGMYVAGDTIFAWGTGVTNLRYADDIILETIIKNIPQ